MSKRRISPRAAGSIAADRMSKLFYLSKLSVRNGNKERAARYVALARRIGQKTRTRVSEEELFCKKCNMPLIAGENCRIRIGDGRVKITCLNCGDIRRMPYTKEQRE